MSAFLLATDHDWDEAAKIIHDHYTYAGWWESWPNKYDRFKTSMMFIASELSEAMEGHRKNLKDDHLPQYNMFDVELADTAIRLLDCAGAYNISVHLPASFHLHAHNILSKQTVPEQLYSICRQVMVPIQPNSAVSWGLLYTRVVAGINNVPLQQIICEKFAYNKVRNDHKKEVRSQTKHGKKY